MLRRGFSGFLAFVLAFIMCICVPVSVHAETTALQYTVGNASGEPGDTVAVPISLDTNTETGFYISYMKLVYDTEALTFTGVTAGDDLSAACTPNIIKSINESALAYRDKERANITTTGEMVVCTFVINENATPGSSYSVSLTKYNDNYDFFRSSSANLYTATVNSGTITVTAAETDDRPWNEVGTAGKLTKAIEQANTLTEETTITLLNDIDVYSELTIAETANVRIVSDSAAEAPYTLKGSGSAPVFTVNGTLSTENVTLDANGATYGIQNDCGTVTLGSGTTVTGATKSKESYGIYNNAKGTSAVCNINSGAAITGNSIGIRNYYRAECNINGGEVSGNTYQGIYNESATVNCNSGKISDNGSIIDIDYTYELSAGGGIYNLGTLTFGDSFEISGNKCWFGGGIYHLGNREVEIPEGVTISGNEALLGGGIYMHSGKVILNGGAITENTVRIDDMFNRSGNGAGVFLAGNANNLPTLTVKAGSITDNQITGSSEVGFAYLQGHGGGIFLNEDAVLNLYGGTVSGNTAPDGAGIYVSNTILQSYREGWGCGQIPGLSKGSERS